jgi:DNA-binding CsgD family transcriptional regulator
MSAMAFAPEDSKSLHLTNVPRDEDPGHFAFIWEEICAGQWETLAAFDAAGMRHALMTARSDRRPIDWSRLRQRERDIFELLAHNHAQKSVAITLGLPPSSVSSVVRSAPAKVGLRTPAQLIRAYCGRHVLPQPEGCIAMTGLRGNTENVWDNSLSFRATTRR